MNNKAGWNLQRTAETCRAVSPSESMDNKIAANFLLNTQTCVTWCRVFLGCLCA